MKLRITIEDKAYDVDVEILDPQPAVGTPAQTNGSAASRVEGLAVRPGLKPLEEINGPARPAVKPSTNTAVKPASAPATAAVASPAPTPAAAPRPSGPREPIRPWHDLTLGEHGEVTAPVAGTIVTLIAKVGDAVRPGDPLLELEVENFFAAKSGPVRGTVRATDPGTIAEIPVRPGDVVKFGQALARVKLEAQVNAAQPKPAPQPITAP